MKKTNAKHLFMAFTLAAAAFVAAVPAVSWATPLPAAPQPDSEGDTPGYSVQYSVPVVIDPSQFYCNNLSTEGSLANLIDGNYDTHFITAYNESRVTNSPDEYHYLQVHAPDGLPNLFVMHWRTRGSTWANMYRPTHILLSVSNDGTTWTEIGDWSNPDAGFPVTADVPEYTSPVIDPGAKYYYFRITVLETNNNGISTDGHPYFNFSEFNLYPVVKEGEETLADVLNSMSLGPDDYMYGTDPGYIGDMQTWQTFYDLYLKAIEYVQDNTHSEDELNTLKDELLAAQDAVVKAVNPIKDGGYYYITTANTAFTGNSKADYGWYAPSDEANHIGWKALEESSRFVWKFTANDDGSYNIQNLLTGMYVDSTLTNDLSQVVFLSENSHKQLVNSLTYAGVFSIEWDGAVAVYNQDGHADGAGESGNVVLWNGQAGTASSWYLREVPADVVERLTSQHNLETLKTYLDMNSGLLDKYAVGTKVGQLNNQTAYDNIKAAYDAATASLSEQRPDEEYATLLQNIEQARTDAEQNYTNKVTEGYYKFVVANPYFLDQEDESLHTLSWAQHSDNANVIEWSKDDGTADYIWKVTMADADSFYIQNISTKRYIWRGTVLQRANNIGASDTPETQHYVQFVDRTGVVNVYNTDYKDYPYHALNWNMALNGTLCYAEGEPSMWYMEAVPAEEAERLAAEALTRNRIDTLRNIINEAELTITDSDIPVYNFDEPVVTDASKQLYSNAQAPTTNEQTSYDNLIDGDYSTIFHSCYNSILPIDDYHYLRVYAPDGLPAKFGIHWAKRCYDANEGNNQSCRPTKIVIGLSNDGTTWEHLDTLTTADGLPTAPTDTFYTSKKPIDGTGYTYFIMKVLKVNNNLSMSDGFGHDFFTMSEYNLYPYTGSNPASQINDPEIKAIIDELQATIATTEEAIASGTIGDDVIPTLQAAYDKLLQAWKDTTVLSRVLAENVMFSNLPDGDGSSIGDVPAESLEKITAAIEESGLTTKPLYTLSKSEIESATTAMQTAQSEFLASVTLPEEGVWYVIQTAEDFPDRADKIMNAGGWYGHSPTGGNQYSYWLDQYTIDKVETNSRSSFVFRRNADGTLTMQNAGSGLFLGPETGSGNTTYDYRPIQWYEPHTVQLIPFGDGQVGFRIASGRYIRGNAAWYADGMTYEIPTAGQPLAYSAFAWQVYPSYDICSMITETQSLAQGRAIAITRPHDLDGLPNIDYGILQGYRIIGKITQEDSNDSIVTAYKLKAYPEDEIIPAGTPVVYIAEGDTYDEEVNYVAEFHPLIDGDVTNMPDTVNGLAGNIDSYLTPVDHLGYFLADSVVDEPVGTAIGYNRGYIMPWLVEEEPDAEPDKIIYVKGSGMLNGITATKVEDASETVDVYSVDGVLIKRGVARLKATVGLAKGIYIIGKEKVLVK